MANVEQRRNVLIRHHLANGDITTSTWYQTINIDFTPDDCILRTAVETGLNSTQYVYTNLINDDGALCILDPNLNSSQQHFTIRRPVRGSFMLQLRNQDGTILTPGADADLYISLEFVKYRQM